MTATLLAEWAPQAATLLCWPHENTDWAPRLEAIRQEYRQFMLAIARFQPVLVLVHDSDSEQSLAQALRQNRPAHGIYSLQLPFTDTWIRDFGPLTCWDGQQVSLLALQFDGWGGKYEADLNNQVCHRLQQSGLFGDTPFHYSELVGEGGNLESDGQSTLLTSAHSFSQRDNANSSLLDELHALFGLSEIIQLNCPPLPGDDTDGHVDTLARLAEDGSILWQPTANAEDTHNLHQQLLATGRKLARLPALPTIVDEGQTLPASYANFLLVNDAVLVPAYGVAQDDVARRTIEQAFPERQAISVGARNLIWQYGSLHCASMQIPQQVPVDFRRARQLAGPQGL